MNKGKKESPGYIKEMEASPWLENKASMYRIMGDKEEREKLWGLTVEVEKLEVNSVGNGETFWFLQGKIILQ